MTADLNVFRPKYGRSGHIYVAELSDGRVKVGFSANPETRLRQHQSTANIFAVQVLRTWVSPFHANAGENERHLIAGCAAVSEGRVGEYFAVSFEAAVAIAQRLDFSNTETHDAERQAAVVNLMKSWATASAERRQEDAFQEVSSWDIPSVPGVEVGIVSGRGGMPGVVIQPDGGGQTITVSASEALRLAKAINIAVVKIAADVEVAS